MATSDEPPDPQEALEAAEAAHLKARTTVSTSAGEPPARPRGSGRQPATDRATVRPDQPTVSPAERPTVRLPPGATPAADRPPSRRRAPLPVAAAVAALVAAVVSFVPVAVVVTLLVMAELGPAGVIAPIRTAAAGWLLAHGVPLDTPGGPVSVPPLALAALAAWRVARAGVHTTRAIGARGRGSPGQALIAAVAVAVAYGVIGALVGRLAGGPDWGTSALRAGLTLAGFGLLAAGYGSLRATGLLAGWLGGPAPAQPVAGGPAGWLAGVVAPGIRAGLVAVASILAAGAALAGVAIAASGAAATDVLAAYRTDVAGQAGLTLLCLAFVPNLAVWSAAYLLGPGFAVGIDTVVRSSEVSVGRLPVLPVFAGLPEGPLPTLGALLLLVPVAAGVISGWLLARSTATWWRRLSGVMVAGVVAAAALGLSAAAAGGALGAGQLATVGPAALPVASVAAAAVTVGALLGAGAAALPQRRAAA